MMIKNFKIKFQSMKQIHFISMECYPCAKVGGLADVVGSLPKYLNEIDLEVSVFIPKYRMKWFEDKMFNYLHHSNFYLHQERIDYGIAEVIDAGLGFRLIVIDIPGKMDRNGVYSSAEGNFFNDEIQRHLSFQRAYLNFIVNKEFTPDVVHCHDHHTGLIPFMMQNCDGYKHLANIPVVFTIHNERYQGIFPWTMQHLLPQYDNWTSGQLDWANLINPLASAVKCAWKVTTVSPSYMEEIKYKSMGLEPLFNSEAYKCIGILNGIDTDVWNPANDDFLEAKLKKDINKFKQKNKEILLKNSGLDPSLPLISFIGRFANEKGADLLPGIIDESIRRNLPFNWVVLGTGDKWVEQNIALLAQKRPDKVAAIISYNEAISHQIYAGSDFILMPSRVEPCGLNQLYAMKYATLPIVHNLGGLKDSVIYFDGENGCGLKFNSLDFDSIFEELNKAAYLFNNNSLLLQARTNAVNLDYSWPNSAKQYKAIYDLFF
jgi:starch synthase